MGALERWWDWFDMLRMRLGKDGRPVPYGVLATRLGVHENSVIIWARTGVPGVEQEEALADLSREPLAVLRALLDEARGDLLRRRLAADRAAFERRARPTTGRAQASAGPSRKLRRGMRGLLLALAASGSLVASAPRVEAARLITSISEEGFCRPPRRRAA